MDLTQNQPPFEESQSYSHKQKTAPSNILKAGSLQTANILGNFKNSFILLQHEGILYLVDQHAASQKITYLEMVNKKMESIQHEESISIDNIYLETIQDKKPQLMSLGWDYEIESLGKLEVVLRILKVPGILNQKMQTQQFVRVVEKIFINSIDKQSQCKKQMVASIACHNSYRFGDTLSDEETRTLIDSISQTQSSFNCPHGRPVIIRVGPLKPNHVEKKFIF